MSADLLLVNPVFLSQNEAERELKSPCFPLGLLCLGVFLYGALPPTFPRYISYLLYRWEDIIRATVIVGLVGAGGLGRSLTEQLASFDYQAVLATLIVFIVITFIIDIISQSARKSLRTA